MAIELISRNRAQSSHPYRSLTIKDGFEEVRWRYPESSSEGELHVVDGAPFTGDITRAVPSRTGYTYPGRVNHEGLYIVGQTGQQVWYESMTEYEALMLIEHTMSVTSVASQPCCFLFRGGTAHYPDYALTSADNHTIIVDVRDLDFTGLRELSSFNRSAQLCDQLGWGYMIIEPLFGHFRHDLIWLAGYRHSIAAPDHSLRARILDAARSPIGLMKLARLLDPNLEWRHLPAIYHLMFTRVLAYDLVSPLDDNTLVWKG